MADEPLPAPVLRLLAQAFPGTRIGSLAPTSGGFSNMTARVTIGARPCVVKAAATDAKRGDVRREAQTLALLAGRDLPAPALLALAEDDRWTVAVTGLVAGEHGLQVLARAPAALEGIFRALGQALAAVHATPLAAEAAPLQAERMRETRAQLPALDLAPDLRALLAESLADTVWTAQAQHLVHGDAGLHNLLWNGQVATLLDWEWSGWGSPLLDLAWLYWTMRWRGLPAALWGTFLSSYGDGPALATRYTPATMQALVYGQIASILARVRSQPAAWAEWLRRLEWTRTLRFPAE